MRHGGGVCYKLIETDPMYISLFNNHGSLLPIMHLYRFVSTFSNESFQISNNYLMCYKDGNYHVILFNKITTVIYFDTKNTLNNEHSIQHLIPQDKRDVYIYYSTIR